MPRKSISEKLAELEEKQKKLKEKAKALKAIQSRDERKKRTRRLIEIGATVEKVFGSPIENYMLPRLEKFLKEQDERGQYFSNALKE